MYTSNCKANTKLKVAFNFNWNKEYDVKIFYFQKSSKYGHKLSNRQSDIFGAQNRQNNDKSLNLAAMYSYKCCFILFSVPFCFYFFMSSRKSMKFMKNKPKRFLRSIQAIQTTICQFYGRSIKNVVVMVVVVVVVSFCCCSNKISLQINFAKRYI